MVSVLVFSGLGVFRHDIGRVLVSIVLLSMASAAAYGLGAVLQHQAAVKEPPELSMRAGLLVRLARRPMWLIGNALDGVGYLFQFLALRRGSLSLVEPLLVLSLVFALPVAAWLDHRPISRSEVMSSGVIAAGLVLFLGPAHPGLGHPSASAYTWVILSAVIAALCGVAVVLARGGSHLRSAVFLAGGSGTALGFVAAVTERTGHLLNGGLAHLLETWTPYALLAGAGIALMLTQSAFHAGALRLSLPTLTVAQPLVAAVIGIWVFGEHVDARGLAPVLEVLGLMLMTVGVFALARSPVIGGHEEKASVDP